VSDFLDPSAEISKHGHRLPHWQQDIKMQFVTFRLGDSLPEAKVKQWKEECRIWLALNPTPWSADAEKEYHRRFTWKLETWLDAGSGSCLFRQSSHRRVLEDILMHDQGHRAEHEAWVIMPNHVHLLFMPKVPLEKLLQTWKGVSARRLGMGSIWQKNYRDTLIRDSDHFANAVRYIRRNPAKIAEGSYTLWESDRAAAIT
jgi:putative transposase